MQKEIIALIKELAGSAETVLIWYFVLDTVNFIIGWIGACAVGYYAGKGFRAVVNAGNKL